MLETIKNILFCPFVWTLRIEGPSEQNMQILREFIYYKSLKIIQDSDFQIIFKAKLKTILGLVGLFRFGHIVVTFQKVGNNRAYLTCEFRSDKIWAFTIFTLLSLGLLFDIIQNGNLTRLGWIPSFYVIGSWGAYWVGTLADKSQLRKLFKEKLFVLKEASSS